MNAFLLHRIRGVIVGGRRKNDRSNTWLPLFLSVMWPKISAFDQQNLTYWKFGYSPANVSIQAVGVHIAYRRVFGDIFAISVYLRPSFARSKNDRKKKASIPISTHRKSTERPGMQSFHYQTAFNTQDATESNELFHHFGSEINVNLTGDLM